MEHGSGPQSPPQAPPGWQDFCSDAIPARQRLDVINEVARSYPVAYEIVPTRDASLYVAGRALALPGLLVAYGTSRGMEFRHTDACAANNGALLFTLALEGSYRVQQHRWDAIIQPGECCVSLSGEPANSSTVSDQTCRNLSLMLPAAALRDARLNLHDLLLRPIRCDNPAMGLLMAYLRGMESTLAFASPALQELATQHIYDLVLLALRGTGDAAEAARGRGLAAARLRRLEEAIERAVNSGQPIHLAELAAREGISPVYVQKLFERAGTSFSVFVLERRLECVHRRLCNPRFAGRTISNIVYDAGFNNLSWFNHAFRRRYGMTPSELRNTKGDQAPG